MNEQQSISPKMRWMLLGFSIFGFATFLLTFLLGHQIIRFAPGWAFLALLIETGVLVILVFSLGMSKEEGESAAGIPLAALVILSGLLTGAVLVFYIGTAASVVVGLATAVFLAIAGFGLHSKISAQIPNYKTRRAFFAILMVLTLAFVGIGTVFAAHRTELGLKDSHPEQEIARSLNWELQKDKLIIEVPSRFFDQKHYIQRNFAIKVNNQTHPFANLETRQLLAQRNNRQKQIKELRFIYKVKQRIDSIYITTNHLFAPNLERRIEV